MFNRAINRAHPTAGSEQLQLDLQAANPQATGADTTWVSHAGARGNGGPLVTNEALPAGDDRLGRLYSTPIPSRRSGPLYNAFSYPTKIDPEVIALFIAAHTSPGDTVLDVFAGSGTTGVAARLCENPTLEMQRRASELDLPVEWGPRNAVLYELSVIGSLLSTTMCDPPDPTRFAASAKRLVATAAAKHGWMYEAEGPDGAAGVVRHIIWSEMLVCPNCDRRHPYWALAVERHPLALRKVAQCPSCGTDMSLSDVERASAVTVDPLTNEEMVERIRHPAVVYGRTSRTMWQRQPIPSDIDLIERVRTTPIPECVPSMSLRWGDLHRSGYHQGIDRIHHFYTRRNLIALGTLWQAIDDEPDDLRSALRLLILSYNATHSTLMTRVVVKTGMSDFVLTGAQSGVLYVSSLPVEKNVFAGVERKIDTFYAAFTASYGGSSTVRVVNASSTQLDLPNQSIDYVFTDPPFGGFIPYAEINQLNEAWLGSVTDDTEEAIVSRAQHKDVLDYATLMKRVFAEVARVMNHDAAATVVFHSSKPDVWASLGDAFTTAGFIVERTSVLDKTQVSFKQVVSNGSTRGDAIFLLSRGKLIPAPLLACDLGTTIHDLREQYGPGLSPQHLYSRYVARCIETGRTVDVTSNDFYAMVRSLDRYV